MIYLCAQPNDFYFIWQVEILIFNLKNLGVNPSKIHVLLGYDPSIGINSEWNDFVNKNSHLASFHFYSDTRESKKYLSSIRPHIIKKHLKKYPKIAESRILYHDSDIIFRKLPDLDKLKDKNIWYVSDTRNYTGIDYIVDKGCTNLLSEMCNEIEISEDIVRKNDHSSGGAQYIINNTNPEFWHNVEKDSEKLYKLVESYLNRVVDENYKLTGKKKNDTLYEKMQAWIADMWAILWNAWKLEIKTEITDELSFCLTRSSIDEWNKTTLLHYTGYFTPNSFNKTNFQYFYPYYEDLNHVDKDVASYELVRLIYEIKKQKYLERIQLEDTSILIPVRIDSESRMQNLTAILKFLDMNFKTNIIIHEVDTEQKIDSDILPENCSYTFEFTSDKKMHRTKINNDMIMQAETPIVILYDVDVVCNPIQILNAVERVRSGVTYVSPYDGRFVSVDNSMKRVFMSKYEIGILEDNKHYFDFACKRSWGGICVIDREKYILSGMENENIKSWGPEDAERVKRLKILGYSIERIKGSIYHLPHDRLDNSGYIDEESFYQYQDEYHKVCNMRKDELQNYISTWKILQNYSN